MRGGWSPPAAQPTDRDAVHDEIRRQLDSVDTFLLGRKCYELWESAWPLMGQRATSSSFEREFSRFADQVQKVVYSKSLKAANWQNTRLASGSIADDVRTFGSAGSCFHLRPAKA